MWQILCHQKRKTMAGKYFNGSKEGVYNSSGQSKLQPLPKDCREIELRSWVMVHACNSSTWEEEQSSVLWWHDWVQDQTKTKVHETLSPKHKPDMVTHAYNPSTEDTEAGGFLQVQSQLGLHKWGQLELCSKICLKTTGKKFKALTWSCYGITHL